jgi:capsular exopolysaccharide synthesis family protein
MLHKRLNVTTHIGLSSLLSGLDEVDGLPGVTAIESIPELRILFSGPVPPYPSELLGSAQMKASIDTWRGQFDFIILDGAPVLPVTDSVILSELVDATLLVARFNLTERQSLERSYQLLEVQARPQQSIGVVLNAVERSGRSYYEYYGYSDSAYYGTREASVA